MAVIWKTNEPVPTSAALQEQIYNGLDCCVTLEVFGEIYPQLNEITRKTYEFSMRLLAPVLEMELRGVRLDHKARDEVFQETKILHDRVLQQLSLILSEGLGVTEFNPGSWQQKQQLFYEILGLPHVRKLGKITTNRDALEKLQNYVQATTLCKHIMLAQDYRKQMGWLKTGIDPDGRLRYNFNVGGTSTGRLSSSESCWGTGTNMQNVPPRMRRMVIADPGYKLAYIDLEQAEARGVGAIIWNLFGDATYLDFCESGDLHTNVTMMTWQDLGWTGDKAHDKELAKQTFYRDFSYRDASKRLGHASNYFGQPPQISRETRIPVGLITQFQSGYFGAFPGIPQWHQWVRAKLRRDGWITTFMGRQRWFHGRLWEDETLRGAIAYEPQSAIADYLDEGIIRIWESEYYRRLGVQLLLQEHDAIVVQYPEETENEVVPLLMKTLSWEVPLMNGRSLVIPTEAQVGWNWGYARNEKKELVNPDGLVPFDGKDNRRRSAPANVLDRRFPSLHGT